MASIKVPHPLPTPLEDSKKLEEAFQGQGSKENAIISILARRNADQRKLISQKYEELYNKKLLQRLEEFSTGFWLRDIWVRDFWKAVTLWTMDPPHRDANLCKKALKNKTVTKKEVEIIVEIACASSPDHLIEVRRAYCALYRHSLEEDIGKRIKGRLRKLLVYLVSSYRYDGEEVDEKLAKLEAVSLHNAIVNNKYSTAVEDEVIRILSSRSKSQLKATFHHYNQAYEESIYKILDGFQALKTSIKGVGTDEDALTRAIITRAEIDMERIKEEYLRLYKTRLEKDVVGDTSGDYKNFLITLLGGGN